MCFLYFIKRSPSFQHKMFRQLTYAKKYNETTGNYVFIRVMQTLINMSFFKTYKSVIVNAPRANCK